MKKIPAILLALTMLVSVVPALGEGANADYSDRMKDIIVIEGTDTQKELRATVKEIIEADGLKFKDLNGNGALDAYEDWRLDTEERITDLYSKMTVEERTRLLYHVCTCGDPTGIDFSDARYLWEETNPFGVPTAEEAAKIEAENAGAPAGAFSSGSYSMWYYINVYGLTHYLDNSNGAPQDQVVYHNAIQQIGEDTRLGIPITFSSDRQYNAWGGMIDTPHDAFGTANDLALAEKLWEMYSKETRAIGYHVLLHPYGVELGSWNGEDPAYLGEMSYAEVNAIQAEGGAYACIKHFIGRGGDSSFSNARSVAQNSENWLYAWGEALKANPEWLMTNGYSTGLSNTVHVDYDKETMDYLRKTLGYDGVVLSDWGDQGDNNSSGVTADGVDLLSLSLAERYAYTINLGLDQMGNPAVNFEASGMALSLNATVEAVEKGYISEERLEQACRRILRTKFNLGLFENPYSDAAEALALSANAEYAAQPWKIVDNDTLMAARNPEEVELERQLQAKSAVLVKNDNDLLPLKSEAKVYFDSTAAASTRDSIKLAIGLHATVVDTVEAADVVVVDCTSFNDASELVIEDAKDANKSLVVVANCVDPTAYVMEKGDAVLFLNFTRGADHGTGEANFITTTEPVVYADILFGTRVPEGMIVKEIARSTSDDGLQWKDLAGDQGANRYVRMLLLALMRDSDTHSVPSNFGDPLLGYEFGMRYGENAEFVYDTLYLPNELTEVTTETSSGVSTSTQLGTMAKAGVPFTAYVILWNNGADGVTTVQAYDGDTLIGEKLMAVNGGSWRVVEMELTLDAVGEHVIQIGGLTNTLTIHE